MRERDADRRRRPVERLISAMVPERAALLERGAGLDAAALRELALTEDGERRVRALLTAPEPGPFDLAPPDTAAMDALLDALSEDNRALLEAGGLDLDVLRRLCAVPGGLPFVRSLVLPGAPEPDTGAASRAGRGPAVPPAFGQLLLAWSLVVVGALVGVALCMTAAALIGGAAFLIGMVYLIFGVTVVFLKVPETRGQGPAVAVMSVAFTLLMVVASFSVSGWYLGVRGRQVAVTVVKPAYTEARGARVPVCRVRFPDGSVRRVATPDAGCADREVGRRMTVVADPSGWFAPHLGTSADLNLVPTLAVAAGAGVPLVLAPAAVLALAARDRRKVRGGGGDV